MTFAECIPLLVEGKKIRRSIFEEHEYLTLDEEGSLVCVNYNDHFHEDEKYTYDIDISDFKATDWEVVE